MHMRKAFTLIEVMIAIAIVMSLCAVLWLVVGPSAKRRGLEATVRSDLHQIHAAIELYIADYDDVLPPSLGAVAKEIPGTPTRASAVRQATPECYDPHGSVLYHFTRNRSVLAGERRYKAVYPFDEKVNALVKAPFFCRRLGTKRTVIFLDDDGNENPRLRDAIDVLGVRRDGTVGWFTSQDLWEEEFGMKAHRR